MDSYMRALGTTRAGMGGASSSLQDRFAECEFDLYTRVDARIRG